MRKKSPTPSKQNMPVLNPLLVMEIDILAIDSMEKDKSHAIAARIAKGQPMKNSASLGPDYSVDKRRIARQEHTNHFTNRAPKKKP
jgi:hypothetical protein